MVEPLSGTELQEIKVATKHARNANLTIIFFLI